MEKEKGRFAEDLRNAKKMAQECWEKELNAYVKKLECAHDFHVKVMMKDIRQHAELAASCRKGHFSFEVDSPIKNSPFREEKVVQNFERTLAATIENRFCQETGFSVKEGSSSGYINITVCPSNTYLICGTF